MSAPHEDHIGDEPRWVIEQRIEQDRLRRAEAGERALIQMLRLADKPLPWRSLAPAAYLLIRAGVISGDDLTFGSDYDLRVRSYELDAGWTHARDANHLSITPLTEMVSLGEVEYGPTELPDEAGSAIAERLFALAPAELLREAQRELLVPELDASASLSL